mgnify:CR=1 FL=1
MRVLFVCLGNICRSPTAEGVVRHLIAQQSPPPPWEVDSAGTADYHVGSPPDPRTRRAAARRGIDLSSLRARQVSGEDFHRFDLILGMDRANLAALRRLAPADARARTGLFLDYAPQAAMREVPDPYYGGEEGFEIVLDLCLQAGQGLLRSSSTAS